MSLLLSFVYKVKFSAGNRWSGESSTGQTERRKRARRTGGRKQGGKGANKRLQSREQSCTTSAKHVSYDNPVKYRNDKSWKLEFTSHHESLSSRSARLSYLLAEWLIQTHKTRLDEQCDKQLFLLLTHVDRKCNSQKLLVRPNFVHVSNSKSEFVRFVANRSLVTSLWRLQQFSENCVIAEFVIHCVLYPNHPQVKTCCCL